MNKKFSTLVAGALLAGAVITPTDLLAQIKYKTGNYSNLTVTETAGLLAANASGNFAIVFQNAGTDYVAVVDGTTNGLVAKPFSEAGLKVDAAKIVITENGSGKFLVVNGAGDKLGLTTTAWADAATTFTITSVAATPALTMNDATNEITLSGTTFAVATGTSSTLTAKLVSFDQLADLIMPVETAKDLSASFFVLMDPATGNVVQGNKGAAPTFVSYTPTTQKMFWSVVVTDNGNNAGTAKFKNKATGEFLAPTAGGAHTTVAVTRDNADSPWKLATYSNVSLSAAVAGVSAINLGAVPADGQSLTGEQLKTITGAGFEASIKKFIDGDKKDKVLANNPFDGLLKPVSFNDGAAGKVLATVKAEDGTPFMLQDEDGNIIVIDLNDKYAAGTETKYAVKAIAPKVLANALNDADAKISGRYAYNFTINASDDFVPGVNQPVASISAATKGNAASYKLGSVDLKGVPTLSAEVSTDAFLNAITIKIGKFNTIDVKKLLTSTPSFFTVTNKNTKAAYSDNYKTVLGLDETPAAEYVKASEALVGYPETQWAITYTGGNLVLTNRERPTITKSYPVAQLYTTSKANVFAVLDGSAKNDTIEFKATTSYTEADGYLRLNADDLRDQKYYLGAASSVFDNVAYFVENHNDNHQIGLDTKKDKATEWNVATYMYEGLNNLGDRVEYRPDTIQVKSILGYYDGDDYKETKDADDEGTVILKMLAYSFQNAANKEYMNYEAAPSNRYATGEFGVKQGNLDPADANIFAVKVVGEDLYNLIPLKDETAVNTNTADAIDWENVSVEKMYSGDGATKGILNNTDMYNQTENDLFTIVKKDAPEYRKVAMADTIKIYRESSVNEAQVLFEKGEFLSIANAVQFPTINPALYVDTAYVNRGNNNRWEYLLAVEAKHWDSEIKCEIEDHPVHKADTTTGRFLVNLMDSANVYAETHLHDNKFINEEDGEQWAKLGFVEGYHTHDTLYLKRPNGTYNVLPMDRSDYSHSIAKFAFRYVDQEAGSYVIETGRKAYNENGDYAEEVGTGYLKWLNGLVVVVSDIEQAEVFNMNEDETRTPTANEGVTASEVSVIAKDGAVIISGAQGKKVTISNVLGQTVANTVISSDKAEIAAPAGVVVVAVEGEAAVKAIVK